jgi:UDP-MurNAc hydroxylase
MLVDLNGRRLLVDPWLIGSCYWRSWWHFPKPVVVTADLFNVDAIYLTHGHFDHFHYPSLRKFDRSVKILVARFLSDRMKTGLQSLGFENIVELPHGVSHALGGGLKICSYQHGFDDSALVVEGDGVQMLNLNDSHVTGLALRQILKRHGQFDFLLRSHAPAQGYPFCYEAEDPAELGFHRREVYIARFLNSIRIVQPRYAIPFASNVCHLHSETIGFNRYNITPREVAETCKEVFASKTPVVVMMPGDSWDSLAGFKLGDPEPYRDSNAVVLSLAEATSLKLESSRKEEELVQPDFKKFHDYMRGFMRALPPGIRLLFRPVIVFEQPQAEHRFWIVDFRRFVVFQANEPPSDTNSIIRIHPAVLMDAVGKDILFFVHISKRLRIWVRKGGMKEDFKFWGLLQLYEVGYLPLRNFLTPRALSVLWRRRFEILEILRSVARSNRFEEKAVPKVY